MSVNIGFTGDFCPWLRMEEIIENGNWKQSVDSVKPFFDANELNVIALECPLVDDVSPIKKTGINIQAKPSTAELLQYLNCSLVATANNHMMDHGEEGLKKTHRVLSDRNISIMGSGINLNEASGIFYREIDSIRFAFINIAENEWSTTDGEKAGSNPLDPVDVFRYITTAKANADFVIVSAHGGHEHYTLPSPRIKKLYRFFIDAGADLVISHHSHMISGYEVYNNKPVFYGLGNFCFDLPGKRNGLWNYGMLVRASFEKGKNASFEVQFVEQNNEAPGVRLLDANEAVKRFDEVKALNEIISDDKALKEAFQRFCEKQKDILLARIEPYRGKVMTGLRKRKLIPSMMGAGKKRLLTNLIRCEAHRDVLLYALKD